MFVYRGARCVQGKCEVGVAWSRSLFGWPSWPGKKKTEAGQRVKIEEGYVADITEYRRNGGKRFESSGDLCTVEEATRFPVINGATLSGDSVQLPYKDNVSLVLVSMRAMGMGMCEQYRRAFAAEFGHSVGVCELSVVDQLIFRLLKKWMEKNLKKTLAASRHGSFMLYSGGSPSVDELKRAIQFNNSIVGYVYLVDQEGLIRWRAHATPTQGELQAMIKCTKQLLNSDSSI